MRKLTSNQWFVLTLWLVLLMLSGATFTINNADYFRIASSFLGDIPFQDPNMALSWQMKAHFVPIWQLHELSVYSVIVYAYARLLSLFTSWFDLMMLASLLKLLFLMQLFLLSKVFLNYKKVHHYLIFSLLIIPLCSSSIVAFLASFYPDSIVIVTLPVICYLLIKPVKYSATLLFVFATMVACTKTQFFYFPLLILIAIGLFDRKFNKRTTIVLLVSFALSVVFVLMSGKSTDLNKYHSNYFGGYLYQKLNNLEIDKAVDLNCVGIDIWGSQYDLQLGRVIAPEETNSCFRRHRSDVSFFKTFKIFIESPILLAKLSFDTGIQRQMTEDYFFLGYHNKYVVTHDRFISSVTQLKDRIFTPWRFLISFLITITSIFLYRVPNAKLLFILGGFSSSQFYVTFFGEGYRDMSRHLFAMNFSFDLLIFVSLLMIIEGIHTLQKSQRASQ